MAIIDLMMIKNGITFTVDLSQDNVQVNLFPVGGAVYDIFYQGKSAYLYFQPKDNLKIISYGVFFPYCFGYGIEVLEMQWVWWQDPAESIITEIAPPDGRIIYPITRHEMEINTYVPYDPPDPSAESAIGLNGLTFNISMVGVPTDFDQTEQKIYPWFKVQHNLPVEN